MTTPATLDGVAAALDTLLNRLAPGSQVPVPAYDRPTLTAAEVQFTDGVTFNPDGSLWALSDGNSAPSPGGSSVPVGTKIPVAFGYISPTKTPLIWKKGAEWSSNWANVDAQWKANPYQIYTMDIEAWLKTIPEGQNSFVLLGYLMTPRTSHVQS